MKKVQKDGEEAMIAASYSMRRFLLILLVVLPIFLGVSLHYLSALISRELVLDSFPPITGRDIIPLSTNDDTEIPQVLFNQGDSSTPLVEIGKINLEKFKFDSFKDESSLFYKVLFSSKQTYQKNALKDLYMRMLVEKKEALQNKLDLDKAKRDLYYLELVEFQVQICFYAFLLQKPQKDSTSIMLSMTVDDAKLIAKRCDEKIFCDS